MSGSGASKPERNLPGRSPYFLLLGLLLLFLSALGFWPQYFSALLGGTMAPHARFWAVHAHALLFTGWLVAFIVQAGLIFAGRRQIHFRLGPWLAAYGFAAALFGLFAGVLLAARMGQRTGAPDLAASFVFAPILDVMLLAGFLAYAVANTGRPEVHKRAMFAASYAIAFVGLARLVDRFGLFDTAYGWQPALLAPLLIAVAVDLVAVRKIYGVLAVALAIQGARLYHEVLTDTEAWRRIGRAILSPFL